MYSPLNSHRGHCSSENSLEKVSFSGVRLKKRGDHVSPRFSRSCTTSQRSIQQRNSHESADAFDKQASLAVVT